jgi:hypothetical protein
LVLIAPVIVRRL